MNESIRRNAVIRDTGPTIKEVRDIVDLAWVERI